MNIFKSRKDFIGSYEGHKTILELLEEVKSIKDDMGDKAYLFDVYLSLFFTAENMHSTFSVASDSISKASELRSLCQSILDKKEDEKEHPLYNRVCEVLEKNSYLSQYQEPYTKLNLLMTLMFDEFIDYATKEYLEEQSMELNRIFDNIRFDHLYRDISYIVSECKMERFNFMLKQKFLLATFMSSFAQGITDELMLCLSTVDLETNKQIFSISAEKL